MTPFYPNISITLKFAKCDLFRLFKLYCRHIEFHGPAWSHPNPLVKKKKTEHICNSVLREYNNVVKDGNSNVNYCYFFFFWVKRNHVIIKPK